MVQSDPFDNEGFVIFQDITSEIERIKFYNFLISFIFEKRIMLAAAFTILVFLLSICSLKILKRKLLDLKFSYKLLATRWTIYVQKFLFEGYCARKRILFDDYFLLLFCFLVCSLSAILNSNIMTNTIVVDQSGDYRSSN